MDYSDLKNLYRKPCFWKKLNCRAQNLEQKTPAMHSISKYKYDEVKWWGVQKQGLLMVIKRTFGNPAFARDSIFGHRTYNRTLPMHSKRVKVWGV